MISKLKYEKGAIKKVKKILENGNCCDIELDCSICPLRKNFLEISSCVEIIDFSDSKANGTFEKEMKAIISQLKLLKKQQKEQNETKKM